MSSGFKTTIQCFWQKHPWEATSAAKWGHGLAERTGTIPNSHTAFPGFITPGRCLYLTRTGLWLPLFSYYCPSGLRHVCHLKQITACSNTLLCFKTCKKSVLCLLDSKWRCMIPVPAVSQELCWLLPPCKQASEDLIFTKHTPSLSTLYFSFCLWPIFLVCTGGWFCRKSPGAPKHLLPGLWLLLPVPVWQQGHCAEGAALWSKFTQLS